MWLPIVILPVGFFRSSLAPVNGTVVDLNGPLTIAYEHEWHRAYILVPAVGRNYVARIDPQDGRVTVNWE